ncbi:hypothetical protein HPB50_006412 [Hyalomma asiaticum]|uniref:Uncharacterized protein n=1 Tax=Hyalomma asiaticum TaxID=266040 RepID=A0ACB7TAQ9_HYAAI|nr:hypothetical protein HPB50_006412 [Hyalomma asiaticum]
MALLLEYTVFGALVTANLSLGLYFSFRKSLYSSGGGTTKDDIFLGNRAVGILPLAASAVASLYSSAGLVAFPAHFYAYGWHTALLAVMPMLCLPLATRVVVPLFYRLQITSIFEDNFFTDINFLQYIRLRFNTAIALTASVIYIFLTGGLRGVVWTDCMQFIIILVAPTALFAKIMVDIFAANSTVQPLSDMDVGMYIGKFDLTSDENVWSCLVGATGLGIYRLCLDQMVVQRIMASPSEKQARRGCDPGLTGAIKSIDQILLMVNAAVTAPFVGLCILAVLFPFVHCKGAGISTLLMVVYQLWHMMGVIKIGNKSPRLPVSVDYCPGNRTISTLRNASFSTPYLRVSVVGAGRVAITVHNAQHHSAVAMAYLAIKPKDVAQGAGGNGHPTTTAAATTIVQYGIHTRVLPRGLSSPDRRVPHDNG